jgi:hypothetical protein
MKKFLTSILLTLALLALTTGTVFAQDTTPTPITGTVQSVTLGTDATTSEPIVIVTLLDDQGATQTVNLSVETATTLGLVTTDATTGETTVANDAVGKTVEIDPATVIGGDAGEEEKEHPVGSALADFFNETLGVDYEIVMTYHDQGAGFGVIAQALWITTKMEGDSALFQTILDAKLSGDYSAITFEDGTSPANWGQFKKAILKGEKNNSLGDIMSGKSESSDETDAVSEGNKNKEDKGNKDKGNKDKGNKGNGNGHGNGD